MRTSGYELRVKPATLPCGKEGFCIRLMQETTFFDSFDEESNSFMEEKGRIYALNLSKREVETVLEQFIRSNPVAERVDAMHTDFFAQAAKKFAEGKQSTRVDC